jgi:hypothetical protein
MRRVVLALSLGIFLGGVAAQGQSAAPAAPAPEEELRRLCATISMTPADGREMARRAECVLAGVLPSPDRLKEARGLSRAALAAGEPMGGLMLYLAYQRDPANQFLRDGKVDPDAYRRLAARSIEQRKEQIDAIEALGFAAGKGNFAAGVLLANYFHDTLAPRNVARVGAITALMMRTGQRTPMLERMAGEADAIAKNAGATKASVRSFFEAYHDASVAAEAGYQAQSGGQSCSALQLQSVSSGEVEDPEYLPLKGTLVADSYLLRGHWSEFWSFQGCGQEVPVKVDFAADGAGGSSSRAGYNKGS